MEILQLNIQGMTCASCVAHVEKGIKKTDGIDMVSVNLATEKATVSYDPEISSVEDIINSVIDSGYNANLANDEDTENESIQKKDLRKLKVHTTVAALLSAPLVLAMFASIFKLESLMFLHNPTLQLILATPVQIWLGARFYKGAFASLKSGNPSMDVLVALGTTAAYLFSIFNGYFSKSLGLTTTGLYFEASAIIITLVLLGKYLEKNAKGKTSEAIKKLMGLQPKFAIVERDNETVEIPISDVLPGDIVLIKPGDRIPVDGIVLQGNTAIDESMITGESMPVEKKPDDKVVSGTINSYGSIKIKAEHVGKDSVLSRIIAIVEEAQGSKAPIQKLADKVASIFVPVVLIVALITFVVWFLVFGSLSEAIISAVAVLVIACPCALGLATPTAIMVGTGKGAQRGILIKNGEILQSAGKLTTIILDKTGTVTQGKPELQEILPLSSDNTEENKIQLLQLAASLEDKSEHPLAKAIVQKAIQEKITLTQVENFSAVPGKGIKASIENNQYLIGTEKFMVESGISTERYKDQKIKMEDSGNTVVILADKTKAIALLAIADSIKDQSEEGVRLLHEMGLKVFMITGDNKRTADSIASKSGIKNVLAEVLPEGKANEVEKLQKQGHIVAMVGDGVNDAPALATADIGIAMGEGSDIAMESADITLMRGDLREIAAAILLSRKTMGKIKQNLFWAFFYNTVGIPFAALGFLNPIIAGAAMAFSSFSVVTNSLSLKNFKMRTKNATQSETIENNVTVRVEGMSCNHCKMTVENAVKSIETVIDAQVDLNSGSVQIQFHDFEISQLREVEAVISNAGYKALIEE